MFKRFTERARRVVVLSQEEARALNHNHIGTEHLLLGLLRDGEGVACRVLTSLGISLEAARREVTGMAGPGRADQAPTGNIPFTSRAKKVLELSLRESLQLGHEYIGGVHILLGLLREGKGLGVQVLVKLGANLDRVRQEVIGAVEAAPEPEMARVASRHEPPWAASLHSRAGDIAKRLTSIEGRLAAMETAMTTVKGLLTAIERRLAGEPPGVGGPPDPGGTSADSDPNGSDLEGEP